MSDQVPTLDLTEYRTNPDGFVDRLGRAYREFGFCGFRNHGISSALIDQAYQSFRSFFSLSAEAKSQYRLTGHAGARGYTGFGVEVARDSDHPDLKEFWQIGRDVAEDHPFRNRMPPNIWPAELPDFQPSALALYDALDDLGRRVLSAMALSLGQCRDYFDDKTDQGNSVLRAIHYPPVAANTSLSVRAGQHEDINLITLLIGSEEPGLEIQRRDGEWIPVTAVPGAILINVGDMLQRLTNHVLPSTTHRVINPPGAAQNRSRYSIPFFLHPNVDFVIETLPSCITEDNPNRYPDPLSSYDFLQQRLAEIGLIAQSSGDR